MSVVKGDLMQWLDTVEVSTQASVLESILVGKCGTVQVRLHCTEKGKDVQKLEIQPNSPSSPNY